MCAGVVTHPPSFSAPSPHVGVCVRAQTSSFLPHLSPTLAAAAGRLSTGPSHPSRPRRRLSHVLCEANECAARTWGGSGQCVLIHGAPLAVVLGRGLTQGAATSWRTACEHAHGQHRRRRGGGRFVQRYEYCIHTFMQGCIKCGTVSMKMCRDIEILPCSDISAHFSTPHICQLFSAFVRRYELLVRFVRPSFPPYIRTIQYRAVRMRTARAFFVRRYELLVRVMRMPNSQLSTNPQSSFRTNPRESPPISTHNFNWQ